MTDVCSAGPICPRRPDKRLRGGTQRRRSFTMVVDSSRADAAVDVPLGRVGKP